MRSAMVFERRPACLRIASGKAVLLAYETLRGVVAMFMAGFRSMVRILTRNGLFPPVPHPAFSIFRAALDHPRGDGFVHIRGGEHQGKQARHPRGGGLLRGIRYRAAEHQGRQRETAGTAEGNVGRRCRRLLKGPGGDSADRYRALRGREPERGPDVSRGVVRPARRLGGAGRSGSLRDDGPRADGVPTFGDSWDRSAVAPFRAPGGARVRGLPRVCFVNSF